MGLIVSRQQRSQCKANRKAGADDKSSFRCDQIRSEIPTDLDIEVQGLLRNTDTRSGPDRLYDEGQLKAS